MAKHGNHFNDFNLKTDQDVKDAFKRNNLDFNKEAEKCRNPEYHVPFYENLISSVNHAQGVKVSKFNPVTGKEIKVIEGDGVYSDSAYWSAFENGFEAITRAVEKSSNEEFLTGNTKILASIEAFLNEQAELWNQKNPTKPPLKDSKNEPKSLEYKLESWTRIMSGGCKLDKKDIYWSDFKELKRIRDNEDIHFKAGYKSATYKDLAKRINKVKSLSEILIRLHICLKQRIPRLIIRSAFAPDVYV